MINKTHLVRYPHPVEVFFDNGYEFKRYFIPLPNYFSIKTVCTMVKNPQSNELVEQVHQVIYNLPVAKYLSNK